MIASTLFLVAFSSHSIAFRGGDSSELCRVIAENTKLPVACLVYDETPIKPFTIKWQELKDLDRLMLPVAKHRLVRSENWISLYRGGLPSIIRASDLRYLENVKPYPIPDKVKEGTRYTIRTEKGTALRVASLNRLELSKPLRVHWLYQPLGVSVAATNVSEVQLLSSIASAMGAKFSSLPDEFRFDFDPKSYRTRYLETYIVPAPIGYPQFPWGERYSIAQTSLGVETMRAITDAQLSKAFEATNGSVSFLVAKDSALHRAALKKLDAVEEMSREKHPSFRQVADAYIILLNRADLSGPFKVMFGPPAQVGLLVPDAGKSDSWLLF